MYIIREGNHIIVIDPCNFYDDVEEADKVDMIILTHEHFDHISGVNGWKERTGAKVVCNSFCAENIQNPKMNLSHHFNAIYKLQESVPVNEKVTVEDYICKADKAFESNLEIEWEGHQIRLISCPGHSDGSILVILDDRYLFSGDTILRDHMIECRFPGGSKKIWREKGKSIVNSLNKNWGVYPGQFESFKLSEKEWD